jgi:hypothetical protein
MATALRTRHVIPSTPSAKPNMCAIRFSSMEEGSHRMMAFALIQNNQIFKSKEERANVTDRFESLQRVSAAKWIGPPAGIRPEFGGGLIVIAERRNSQRARS